MVNLMEGFIGIQNELRSQKGEKDEAGCEDYRQVLYPFIGLFIGVLYFLSCKTE